MSDLAERLARLGLRRDWDFVLHLPLRYEDESAIVPVAALQPGREAQVEGEIVDARVLRRAKPQLTALLRDDSGTLALRWLHFYPSQRAQAAVGQRVRAYGLPRSGPGGALGGPIGLEMIHPRLRRAGAGAPPLPVGLTPVYSTTEGLPQAWLRKRIDRALRDVDLLAADRGAAAVADAVSAVAVQAGAADLAHLADWPLSRALPYLHRPPPDVDAEALADRTHPAWLRVKFEELLAQQVTLRQARERRARQHAPRLVEQTAADGLAADLAVDLPARLLATLPFVLTDAQQRVWREVQADLARGEPMHRLIQGDVGSGKTVVAALAAARAVSSGHQAVLMAPTEILAEQHFGRIAAWLEPLGVRIAWLAGRQRAAERREALQAVTSGDAALVVGTHALIQEGVRFARLGLAIVDEQHRFGVLQRLQLRQAQPAEAGAAGAAAEGATANPAADAPVPHLLMLSATPIPRTLAMSYLADLDVSVIDALPPGRRPVVTKLLSQRRRTDLVAAVRAQVARGEQVYWVCPLVEAEEQEDGAHGAAGATGGAIDDDPFDPDAFGGAAAGAGAPVRGTALHADAPRDVGAMGLRAADPEPLPLDDAAPQAATEVLVELRAALPELAIGLLHGQLPPAEKAAVMAAFADGRIQVLVATTVVEVGVDVANASLMVIDHAQRFGLAQLHQLRGRVGRGTAESFCVLLYDEPLSLAARERLRVVHGTQDGFEIARRDLALRGPGEFLGARQAGQPLLHFADLERDVALVERARAVAAVLMRENPAAARAHAERWLASREGFLAA